MRVIVDFYFDDLEAWCPNPTCEVNVIAGPYSDEKDRCWRCSTAAEYHRAFGTEEQRSKPVDRLEARIMGVDL